ncbi:hypothetical protein PtB15_10B520 [Puccinia triticina]|nr:hypothetical protein PtB15_10B520 [Puccinia triticina]
MQIIVAFYFGLMRSLQSLTFHNQPIGGDNLTCQPSLVALYQTFFTIPSNESVGYPGTWIEGDRAVPGLFQWKVDRFYQFRNHKESSRMTRISTPYSAERLDCSINLVRSDYNLDTNGLSIGICATCLLEDRTQLEDGSQDMTGVCTSWDSNAVSHPRSSELDQLYQVLSEIEQLSKGLSIPAYSLPLSAYPPGYNASQEDLYRGTPIKRISQVTLILDHMVLLPPNSPRRIRAEIGPSTTIQSPEGQIVVNDKEVLNMLEAFKATFDSSSLPPDKFDINGTIVDGPPPENGAMTGSSADGSGFSVFSIKVPSIGDLKPVLHNQNLTSTPEVLQSMFNRTMNANSLLMDLAARDLHHSTIGVNYMCTETKKEWQPFLKGFSMVVAGATAVFNAVYSMLLMLARKIDSFQKKENKVSDLEAGRHPSTLTLNVEEHIALANRTVD